MPQIPFEIKKKRCCSACACAWVDCGHIFGFRKIICIIVVVIVVGHCLHGMASVASSSFFRLCLACVVQATLQQMKMRDEEQQPTITTTTNSTATKEPHKYYWEHLLGIRKKYKYLYLFVIISHWEKKNCCDRNVSRSVRGAPHNSILLLLRKIFIFIIYWMIDLMAPIHVREFWLLGIIPNCCPWLIWTRLVNMLRIMCVHKMLWKCRILATENWFFIFQWPFNQLQALLFDEGGYYEIGSITTPDRSIIWLTKKLKRISILTHI